MLVSIGMVDAEKLTKWDQVERAEVLRHWLRADVHPNVKASSADMSWPVPGARTSTATRNGTGHALSPSVGI